MVRIQLNNLGSDGLPGRSGWKFTEKLTVGEHREDDVAPQAIQAHHRRIEPLALGPLLLVVGPRCWVAIRC